MAKTTPTKNAQPGIDRPVDRTDIENRLRDVRNDFESVKSTAAGAGLAVGLGVALLLVLIAFIIGRRRGLAKYAFVEIRRA
jgi:hypothetical protein